MLITVIEGRVPPERGGALEQTFRESLSSMPSGILETFLTRDVMDPSIFRILTVWADRPALEAARASGRKPAGIQLLEAVGVEHRHFASEVVVHGSG